MPMSESVLNPSVCPVCQSGARPFDVVDFNKSCDLTNDTGAPLSGIPVYYFLCEECGFLFAPEIQRWTPAEFAEKIYNAQYVLVDPEYVEVRPRQNAQIIEARLGTLKQKLRHLDYGGGNGTFSRILARHGWDSASYDPFADQSSATPPNGKYQLLTAFEVIEHAPDVNRLVESLREWLAEDGVLLVSTSVSDGQLKTGGRLSWWYASPRNGHISIFSSASLTRLFAKHGLQCVVSNEGIHMVYRTRPEWISLFVPPRTFRTRVRDVLGAYPPALNAAKTILRILRPKLQA